MCSRTIPKSPTSLRKRVFDEICIQFRTAAPTLAGFFIYRLPWLISLWFVGRLGATELAAAAFGNSLCNILGMALVVGLNSALTTLASQAKGEVVSRRQVVAPTLSEIEMSSLLKSKEVTKLEESAQEPSSEEPFLPSVVLFRAIIVQLLFCVPVALGWIAGIRPVLIWMGQTEELARMTSDYLRYLAPALLCYSVNWTMVTWLQSIGMADVPPMVALIGLLVHVPCTYGLVQLVGYKGCAIATSFFQFIQPVQLIIYLFFTEWGRQRILESTGALSIGMEKMDYARDFRAALSLDGICQFLGLALPALVAISEWWASELLIVFAGRLQPNPELALGAMTLFQSLNSLCYMVPVSFSVAGSTRVGNLLGASDADGAAFAGFVNVLYTGFTSVVLSLVIFLLPHTTFPAFFASSATDTVHESSRLIPILCLYIVGDAFACAFNGIIKGCGRQRVAMPIILISYWLIGTPLAYFFAFVRHDGDLECQDLLCGTRGLTAASTIGTWLHFLLLGITVSMFTNWNREVDRAMERVKAKRDSTTTK